MTQAKGVHRTHKTKKARVKSTRSTRSGTEGKTLAWVQRELKACEKGFKGCDSGLDKALKQAQEEGDSAALIRIRRYFEEREAKAREILVEIETKQAEEEVRTGSGEGSSGFLAPFGAVAWDAPGGPHVLVDRADAKDPDQVGEDPTAPPE